MDILNKIRYVDFEKVEIKLTRYISKHHAMKIYGKWRCSSMHF
jgi:hypothetical protein